MLRHNMADHTQQITAGYILKGSKMPQVVANSRICRSRIAGGLSAVFYWFDSQDNLLFRWPRRPLSGNLNFAPGNWPDNGKKHFFWHRFEFREGGKGALFFTEPVYRMFGFLGNGAEQVITWDRGVMRVYGHRDVTAKAVKCDSEYVRNSITNCTHY